MKTGKKTGNLFWGLCYLGLIIVLILSVLTAITFGNAEITVSQVYEVLFYKLFHLKQYEVFSSGAIHDVVWLIRFPRVLLAIAIGIGLSVCGDVMQAVVKNPLADPYVLGISSGASFGATLAIMLGIGSLFGNNFTGVMAFLGALGSSFLVISLSNIGGKAKTGKLILAGMAVGSICSAFSNFVLYIANDRNATTEVTFWTMGSLAGAKWDIVKVVLPIMILGALFFWTQSRNLNLMLLGEDTAITLGTDLRAVRILYLILVSIMVGFAVFSSGIIGFVGLIIPHAVRMVTGTDHKKLIPTSALVGSIFLVWADVASRVILKHSELPIGILISLIGAPCFVILLIRKSYGFGGKKT